MDTDNKRLSDVSRRRFIQTTGLFGAAGLAGCSGDGGGGDGDGGGDGGDGNDTGGGDGGGGQPMDDYYDHYTWEIPTKTHMNPYANTGYDGKLEMLLFDRLAAYSRTHEKWLPRLAKDWNYENKTYTLNLREDVTFHDGESQFTSADVVTQLTIQKHLDMPIWDYVEKVNAPDDYTVELQTKGVTQGVIDHSLLGQWMNTPEAVFGEWATKLEEAGSDSEREDIISQFLDFRPKDPTAYGPAVLQQRQSDQYVTEFYDDYALTDSFNFTGYRLKRKTNNQEKWAAIRTGDTDAAETFAPQKVIDEFPDHVAMMSATDYGGSGLLFQHEDEVMSKVKVRKALAYFINREKTGEVIYSPVNTTVKHLTGLPPALNKTWIGDDRSKLEQYDHNPEKGAQLLKEAGFSKQNGTWVDSNGNPFSFSIKVGSCCPNQISGYEAAASALQNQGMKASIQTMESSAFWGETFPNGNYKLAQAWWGDIHPYLSLRSPMGPNGDLVESTNFPTKIEVPSEFGNPDSSKETIDVSKKLNNLLMAQTEEEIRTHTKELAWAFNQTLPILPIVEKKAQSFVSTDHWTYAGAGSAKEVENAIGEKPIMGVWWQPPETLLRGGHLKAKTE